MRFATLLFSGLAVCSGAFGAGSEAEKKPLPPYAIAKPAVAAEYEKRMVSASDWSKISDSLRGTIPGNVIDEFSGVAKNLPFPTVTKTMKGLVVKNADGRGALLAFRPNGKVTVNGKVWRTKPLTPVLDEIQRLANFIDGEAAETSLFDRILPSAKAGPAGSLGVAAAVYSNADLWKGDACDERELSEELNRDCPLMAVPMLRLARTESTAVDPQRFLPIAMKCPSENGGILELISKNAEGESERTRWSYGDKDGPQKINVMLAEKNKPFQDFVDLDLSKDLSSGNKKYADMLIGIAQEIQQKACKGSRQGRARYDASLNANRQLLRAQTSDNSSNDTKMLDSL